MYMPWRSKGDDDADNDESRGVRGSVFEQTLMFPLAPTARLVSVLPPTILFYGTAIHSASSDTTAYRTLWTYEFEMW
jgi:hypothetical protein